MAFECDRCGRRYAHAPSLSRHRALNKCSVIASTAPVHLACNECGRRFTRRDNLTRHQRVHKGGRGGNYRQLLIECGLCDKFFATKDRAIAHRRELHQQREKFVLHKSAHRKACEMYRLLLPARFAANFSDCVTYCYEKVMELVLRVLVEKKHAKISFNLVLRFSQPEFGRGGGEEDALGVEGQDVITMHLRPKTRPFMFGAREDTERKLASMFNEVNGRFDDFVHHGSGWVLRDCLFLEVEVGQCLSLQGSCSLHRTDMVEGAVKVLKETPAERERENAGNRCFYHAIAAFFLAGRQNWQSEEGDTAIDPVVSFTEVELESFVLSQLNESVDSPVPVHKIAAVESSNAHLDLAINVVYCSEDGELYPCRASPNLSAANQITLLLFHTQSGQCASGEMDFGDSASEMQSEMHYALLTDVSTLLATRDTDDKGRTTHTRPKHVCFNCFSAFVRTSALEAHVEWCHKSAGQIYAVPYEGEVVEYQRKQKEFKVGYMFFFDFETLQCRPKAPCSCAAEKREAGKCKHKTEILSEHRAFAYSLVMVDRSGLVVRDLHYVGEDAAEHFLRTILDLEAEFKKKLARVEPMVITGEQEEEFRNARVCHICHRHLGDLGAEHNPRVRDHDHITGEYLGAAHNICNLHRKEMRGLVGFAHNFSGYDSHLLMEAISRCKDDLKIMAIPLNTEKFKLLKINHITLLDSLAFLSAPLDKLVGNLNSSDHPYPILAQWLSPKTEEGKAQRDLILRKGVYPYDYMTGMEKLDHPLPSKEQFFSRLTQSHITDEAYDHACRVWRAFHCADLRDYTTLYVRADTFQLAEAVVDLRDRIWDEYRVDLCHYWSLPMLTKDVMLKTTGVKMGLISDLEMIMFLKRNIRGGLSYVNKRHFDAEKERASRDSADPVCAAYVDANNLYGAAMRFPLPLDDFEWVGEEELASLDVERDLTEHSSVGYILEVTLDYPPELHLDHNAFPLAPEHMVIDESMLSPYATNALQTLTKKKVYKAEKLSATFHRRERYVCHGLNLRLYLRHGLKLVSVHRAVRFTQERFLKPYIDRCTERRAAAKTKTGKDLQKMLANSLYGKMIESGGNRMDCRFVRSRGEALRRNTDPRMQGHMIVNEEMSVAFMRKKRVKLNQNWAVGFAILELSKYVMQTLMYDAIKPAFGGRVGVLLSDTDSWVLVLPAPSTDLALEKLHAIMDFSNYPPGHRLQSDEVKNSTGFLKNESPSVEIAEVVAVRSKTYALRMAQSSASDNKCKGVKRSERDRIAMEDYRKCVRRESEPLEHSVVQYGIQSKRHVNRLIKQRRLAFSSFDDKRYLLCAVHSVPYGSSLIDESRRIHRCYFCAHPQLLA